MVACRIALFCFSWKRLSRGRLALSCGNNMWRVEKGMEQGHRVKGQHKSYSSPDPGVSTDGASRVGIWAMEILGESCRGLV